MLTSITLSFNKACDTWRTGLRGVDGPPPWTMISTANKQTNPMTASTSTTYNGWANYETWNASLWIGNDEFLYNTARACVTYAEAGENVWDKFVRCMTDGMIGRFMGETGDGVRWDDPAIDAAEMVEMMTEL